LQADYTAKPVSNDKRAAIVKHVQAGENKDEVAKWLLVNECTVRRVWSKYQKQGYYEPEPLNCGRKTLVNKTTMDAIVAKIKHQPDITLLEFIDEFKLPISKSALCRKLRKLGLTFKKNTPSKQTTNPKSSGSTHNLSQNTTRTKRIDHLLA
jgi:transposase